MRTTIFPGQMSRNHARTLAVLLLVAATGAQAVPPPPAPTYETLDISRDAARWSPGGAAGAAAAESADGQTVLRLPVRFAGTTEPRAYWDARVQLDLARDRGLRFMVYCEDPAQAGYFNVYLRSGGGWYNQTFSCGPGGAWREVLLDKWAFGSEDSPAGFARVDGIRVSAWRGGNADTVMYVAHFGRVPATGNIGVVRADSAMPGDARRARTIQDFTAHTAALLDRLGLPYVPLADLDLAAHAGGLDLLLFPYNPSLPDTAYAAVERFVTRGGKLITCFNIPAPLARIAQLAPGAYVGEETSGQFASIRPANGGLPGMPDITPQASWNIVAMTPANASGRVAARWHTAAGVDTGHPAVVVTERAAHLTHLFLRDAPDEKARLLLAMVGHLLPNAWETAARAAMTRAGAFGPYTGFEQAVAGLSAATPERARADLEQARAFHARAGEALARGDHPGALANAAEARNRLFRAYAAAQPARPGEFRGFWCHNAYGVPGMSWDEAVRNLAANGFNAVLPNMLWGGVAYYPSSVLPVAADVGVQGDALAQCLAACRKYGVACHVWKVNWNMGGGAPAPFKARMKAEGRTQVDARGAAKDDWLCPSHPDNQQLEIDAMVEAATRYQVDGVHFDYIRYPDADHCYCQGCRRRFEAATGAPVGNWPAAVASGTPLRAQWLAFRRAQITRVVSEVRRVLDDTRPGVKVSAAVFREAPRDRDTIGQDWEAWCRAGYLDFVCPMNYTPHTDEFARMTTRQRAWTGEVPLYPGIGFSTWSLEEPAVTLFEQIQAARGAGAPGFVIFNYAAREAAEIVPLCGLGITRTD